MRAFAAAQSERKALLPFDTVDATAPPADVRDRAVEARTDDDLTGTRCDPRGALLAPKRRRPRARGAFAGPVLRLGPYLMKRISEYFGSGQRSSGTIRSSVSATS